ncbi:MAG: phosphatase PAP2 family protein [Deltaproteobacteria bacterium]|nr:phosphatase PAP2 family protein [Deltaproteobacteria bacterium]MBN2674847.1 phosphatase PAP2 family protein [Deltaproteobacteria bacterium]
MIDSDVHLFVHLNQLFFDWGWTRFFAFVTHFGNGWTQAAFIVPLLFLFKRAHLREHLPALVITAALGGLLVVGVKEAVARPRPAAHFVTSSQQVHTPSGTPRDYSFPSGHTQTAFSTAAYLSCLYPMLSPVFLLLAVLVGVSRIAIGVHFPLDVLVGALLGAGCGGLGFWVNRRRLAKRNHSFTP